MFVPAPIAVYSANYLCILLSTIFFTTHKAITVSAIAPNTKKVIRIGST